MSEGHKWTLGCLDALMADDRPVENSTYWRNRAEEARTLAERMLDAYTKVLMLGIAESYERIAHSYDVIASSMFERPIDPKQHEGFPLLFIMAGILVAPHMSAIGCKADMGSCTAYVAFDPKRTSALAPDTGGTTTTCPRFL